MVEQEKVSTIFPQKEMGFQLNYENEIKFHLIQQFNNK